MSLTEPLFKISVVIPLFNEAACLVNTVGTVLNYLTATRQAHEVILVDDGSIDDTRALCKDMAEANDRVRLITFDTNRGKGCAVKTGVLNATGDYVIYTDADLAVPIHFLGPCLDQLKGGASVAIGSRHLPESVFKIREGRCRRALGEVFRQFAKASLCLDVSDVTCGFKGFSQKAGFDIFSRSRINRWGYDAEILFLAKRLGYTVTEIPVEWYHSFNSKVHVALDSLRTLWEIFQIHYNAFTGFYDGQPDVKRYPAGVGQGG